MMFDLVWLETLEKALAQGKEVSPRGRKTLELPQHTVVVDTRRPVLLVPERKLSYQFMAAEAYWILTGDNRVETIAPWNRHIAQFSDDGKVFAGAYGPMVVDQLDYVVKALAKDCDTRQAVMTIWRPNPPPSKDIPCTVALDFKLRDGKLNCHAFMRSSDQWLGLPYDVFNFSMLTHLVCGAYHMAGQRPVIEPGTLYLTAASSHLYEEQWDSARKLIRQSYASCTAKTPEKLYTSPAKLLATLEMLRDTKAGDSLRWWDINGVWNE